MDDINKENPDNKGAVNSETNPIPENNVDIEDNKNIPPAIIKNDTEDQANKKESKTKNMHKLNNDGGKSIVALVLGIISCLFVFTGPLALLGIIAAIIGLIMGINSNKIEKNGMATAGIILSIIGLVFCVICFMACVVFIGGAVLFGSEIAHYF
ncbi:hypothetical protein SDC9_166593 [bioreactor metagenome]|uniref:DUF4190 domain-containing protein n=1 Tax=bioreactor metagenome TaxID=1076179 RepID=A0A645FXH9_9ZZZZ